MSKTHQIMRWITKLLEWVLIVAMAALVFDVLWGVISRHVLSAQSSWTEELARFLLIWVGLLGSSLAFQRHAHLGVDYFVGKLHPSGGRVLKIVVLLLVLAFAGLVLIGGGWTLVSRTLAMGQTTPALGIPKGWVYLAVPVSGVFITVFTLSQLVSAFRGTPDQEVQP